MFDGVVETKNKALRGDVIMAGLYGEHHVIRCKDFLRLYNVVNEVATPRPVTRIVARLTKSALRAAGIKSNDIEFTSSWGEKMAATVGDYIVKDDKGVYRIAAKAFKASYALV